MGLKILRFCHSYYVFQSLVRGSRPFGMLKLFERNLEQYAEEYRVFLSKKGKTLFLGIVSQ